MKTKKELAFEILTKTDGYKLLHADQYPKETEYIYSNLSTRKSNHPFIKDNIYVFGLDYIKEKILKEWEAFFSLNEKEIKEVLNDFKKFNIAYHNLNSFDENRYYDLWKKGELPVEIKFIPNRTLVPLGFPIMNIYNTDPNFYWMTNYIESYLLTSVWPIITSSTISYHLKQIFKKFLDETSDKKDFENQQGSDFSYRGMSGNESGILSGIGHLSNFSKSSTLRAVLEYKKFYGKLAHSVPATEHSVMMSYEEKNEEFAYENLINLYPTGNLSIVSDTWDLWRVADEILPKFKHKIEKRDGKIIIRPDSGNPIKIMCGDKDSDNKLEKMGLLKILDKHFGTSINSKGYKVLNEKIGIIYGDSITYELILNMLKIIKEKGYSTENIVFGLGGTFYQNHNRDTFGFVFKATYAQIDGKNINMQKTPITNLSKKSGKGLVGVFNKNGFLEKKEELSMEEFLSERNLIK